MSNIDFSNVIQVPDNSLAISGDELLFGAQSRTTPPKIYKFPFKTSGITNPIATFYGIVTGRNNFMVTDGTVTNFKITGDLVGIGTDSPDGALSVVKNGVYTNDIANFKNSSNTSTNALTLHLAYGAGGSLVNGTFNAYNNAFVDNGAARKNSVSVVSDGAQGISLVASNATGFASVYTGGAADANERIRVYANGNIGIGFPTYSDAGYRIDANGTIRATRFIGTMDWANLVFETLPVLPSVAIDNNTNQAATTAFVQSRARFFKSNAPTTLSTNSTLVADNAGNRFNVAANSITVTLPLLSTMINGATFFFRTAGNYSWTLACTSPNTIGSTATTSRSVQAYEIIEVSASSTGWEIVNSTFENSAGKFAPLVNPTFDAGTGADTETDVFFGTGGIKRFGFAVQGTAGSAISLNYYDNSGVYAGYSIRVNRSTGYVSLPKATTATLAVGTNTTDIASTAHVYASVQAASVPARDGKLGRILTEADGINGTWQPLHGATSTKTTTWTPVVGGNYLYNPTAAVSITFPSSGLNTDDMIRINDILGAAVAYPLTISFGTVPFRGVVQILVIDVNNSVCNFRYIDNTIGWILD